MKLEVPRVRNNVGSGFSSLGECTEDLLTT